jgi:hypothetical protein
MKILVNVAHHFDYVFIYLFVFYLTTLFQQVRLYSVQGKMISK